MQDPEQLTTSKMQSLVEGFFWLLPNIGIGLAVLAGFWIGGWAARRAIVFAFKRRRRHDLGELLGGFLRWTLILAGVLVFATIVFPSVKPSDLLATLGIGSLAVGLAFRDILQNWFSGMMILYSQPFRVGDQIVSGDHEGTVEHVEARATLIKTYDGQRVVIPNSNLYTRSIVVRTHYPVRRSQCDVTIGYADDPDAAAAAVLAALSRVEGVVQDPPPDARAWEIGESGVVLRVRWWTDSTRSKVVAAQGRAVAAIRGALQEAGVDMPYPTRTVLFHDQTDEADGDRTRQREGWPAGKDPPAPRPLNALTIRRAPQD
ncbi:mechanosensitive ion channel family protein [Roseomonas sp. SSH11]|uniref:Small-conductance mechanosensitive channel n=1 Tax=Pararoseomonas baculiformis TaxID=2820812 RepID=A0ABS4AE96_9PROT|nr:mechanosensitive ion channel family protein [Pararoseomonas baculiformis]MBP0445335.1 mechanosensitive ion channel family protein [Pararoseomonas baculiformis]